MNAQTARQDHWFVACWAAVTVYLVLTMKESGLLLLQAWRWLAHVLYYRGRPGKIRPRPLKSNLTEQSVLVTTPDLAAGVRQMWFELSNQHFNQRQVLTQDQLEMVAQAAEAYFDGPVYGIQWAGQMYRAWQAPAITLHRFPDDAVIPTQRRWSPGQ
jgi:hypothetical protein